MTTGTTNLSRITIPREVFWLCIVAPWLTAPLIKPDVFELSLEHATRWMAADYLPFLGIPSFLWVVYGKLVVVQTGGDGRALSRFVLHFAIATGTASLAAIALRGPHMWLSGLPCPWLPFIAKCVVVTWMFMLPTVIVQEQRARTDRAERFARAAREAQLEAQLEALQARTNPHFLFNGINTVASLIPEDPARAEETLLRLADILRYTLEGSRSRLVPLGRELDVVRDYLEVQAARFGARLRFELDIELGANEVAVPPLCLQTLVENAVLHGVGKRREGGHVQVRVRCRGGFAHIEVLDDGVGPGGSGYHGSGTALTDLKRRIALLFGDTGRLESGPGAHGGFRVCLTLPAGQLT